MDSFQKLSTPERDLLMLPLPIINKNMDFFVVRFYYYYFLHTKAGLLFKKTNIIAQQKMFGSELNAILIYVTDPVIFSKIHQVFFHS